MNKIVSLISIFKLVAFSLQAQSIASIDSTYQNSHYSNRLEFFTQMPNQKKEIVFLGNSITEAGKWQELIQKKAVINRGISGDVTYGVLARIDEVLASKPVKIFLLIGINDMKRGFPQEVILANFRRIIAAVKTQSPKTKLYIQSILPVHEKMLPASYAQINNEKINQLNHQLEILSKEQNLTYINLHPVFKDGNGSLKKELTNDGLHLLQASYILWAQYLKDLKLL